MALRDPGPEKLQKRYELTMACGRRISNWLLKAGGFLRWVFYYVLLFFIMFISFFIVFFQRPSPLGKVKDFWLALNHQLGMCERLFGMLEGRVNRCGELLMLLLIGGIIVGGFIRVHLFMQLFMHFPELE